MIVRKAYKYCLKVRKQNLVALAQVAGCQRYIWNHFLALQKARLDRKERCLSYADMCKELTQMKGMDQTAFLKEPPSQTLQQTLKDLDRGLRDAFGKKKGFPSFKKRGVNDSFRLPQGVKVEDNALSLPKIGCMRFFSSSAIKGKICNTTVSRRGRHWFVSIQTEQEVADPVHPSKSKIGIDMGVVRFATLSTGEYFEPLNSFARLEGQLAREQRKLSRKVKLSSNWKKQKQRVQAIHIRIADARRDYLHQLSHKISQNHAVVVMEDLKVSQMCSSESGNQPNKLKRNLNRKMLDQGWYEFRRQLEYKLLWRGGQVLLVDPRNTSRTCPLCQHVAAENRKSQSQFCCVSCGFSENADLVAACNILMAVGHTVSACGDTKPLAV